MEILAGFNDVDVKAVVLTHRAPLIAQERLVGDDSRPSAVIVDPLPKAEGYFTQLSKQLDAASAALAAIRDQGLKYEQTRSSASLAAANAALASLRAFFENTVYGKLAMGPEMMFGAEVPPYVFRIMAGTCMDQWENFPLGTGCFNCQAPELMRLEALGLDVLDVTKPSKEWLPGIEIARNVFMGEMAKVGSYLKRISFLTRFQAISAGRKTDVWTMRKNMFEKDPMQIGRSLFLSSIDYCEYSILLLEEIRKCAEENVRNLEAKKDSGALVFHTQLMIDEIDRLASHAQFNGMNILTGRFAKPTGQNSPTGSIWFQIGTGMDQRIRAYIGTMTANALLAQAFTTKERHYDIEADFSSKEGSGRVLSGLQTAMARVRGYRDELGRVQREIPAKSPLSFPRIMQTAIKKRMELISSYKLASTLAVTPGPGMSVPEQNALYFTALYSAYNDIYDLLLQLRDCHLLLCSAVYADAERDILLKKAAGIIERINQRAKSSYFAGKLLLPAAGQITAALDAEGLMKKKPEMFPSDAAALGISDVTRRMSWDFSPEYANRELGVIDFAISRVRVNLEKSAMIIESAGVAQERESLYARTLIKAGESATAQQAKIEERWKGMRLLIADSLAAAQYSAWVGNSSVYTYDDRMVLQSRLVNQLEDCEVLLNSGIEILAAVQKNTVISPQNRTRYGKLLEGLSGMRTAFMDAIKERESFVFSPDFANRTLSMIQDLQKMIAEL